jgi:GH25 family lysozyme M1 (1,4-beta-N-acetylmuramidase)
MSFKETGIDVSWHNGNIDWSQVAKDNDDVNFVFIKSSQGLGYSKTQYFYDNVPKAKAVGLHVGPYHYGTFPDIPTALAEAKYCESVISKVKDQLDFPVVLDLEENKDKVSKKQLTDAALAFMDYFKNKGYQALLYTGDYFLDSNLDEERLKDAGYLFWIARYGSAPNNENSIHQYSDSGKVDGIKGLVDMDVAYLDFGVKAEKEYMVISTMHFWQAKALVAEYQAKGYTCQGSSVNPLGPNEKPVDDTKYKFIVKCTHSQAVRLVIELKTKGYKETYGTEVK